MVLNYALVTYIMMTADVGLPDEVYRYTPRTNSNSLVVSFVILFIRKIIHYHYNVSCLYELFVLFLSLGVLHYIH